MPTARQMIGGPGAPVMAESALVACASINPEASACVAVKATGEGVAQAAGSSRPPLPTAMKNSMISSRTT